MARITIAALQARIAELETENQRVYNELQSQIDKYESAVVELNGLYQAQRPSRIAVQPVGPTSAVVYLKGIAHEKVIDWVGGRRITTYKPLSGVQAVNHALDTAGRTHTSRIARSM